MPRVLKTKIAGIEAKIGRKIRERRLEVGWTQEALSESISVTYQQVQKYETGQNRVSASRLYLIAEALQVPVAYFFAECSVGNDDEHHRPMDLRN